MSNRFAIFIFFVWTPLMLIGGSMLGDHYRAEFQELSVAGQSAVFYGAMLVCFAPVLWQAFCSKAARGVK